MPTPLWTYLADDHDRLDRAFQRAVAGPGTVDEEAYREFRQGLLRHIGIEEKILIPLLQPHLDDHGRAMLERIRADHSAIVALLVPPPTRAVVHALHRILDQHNVLEEQNGGFYALAERLDDAAMKDLEERIRNAPQVRSLPNNPDPRVLDATRRALERAGYDPEEYLTAS